MTKLSIIIVNYNVKYFLEQALRSVQNAMQNVEEGEVEVFVVDNNSEDDSVSFIQEKFAWVQLIENKENTGFSTANNQAIALAKGEYVLLLNPDTVIEEDTLSKVLHFMDAHPKAGALGVKMIDGGGNFLPESKRGLPSPFVAFCKIFGLSALFPKSKKFNQYHLGFLSEDETHEVDVLSGAFMLLRKTILDEVGYLDETFFMYGEDVDLSYRIQQAGFQNYYFPETTIIHYKGESTKKGSLNYVKMFYKSMSIFADKHFSSGMAGIYHFAIQLAIIFRAILSVTHRFLKQLWQPVVDVVIIWGGILFIKKQWVLYMKAGITYPENLLWINIPLYILVWISSIFLSGGYDKPLKINAVIKGLLIGTVLIAALYGFLPESLRFSRAIIVLGAIWSVFMLVGWRYLFNFIFPSAIPFFSKQLKRVAIAGTHEESIRVQDLLNQVGIQYQYAGNILPATSATKHSDSIGHLNDVKIITKKLQLDEIIFCSKDISSNKIIAIMTGLGEQMSYRIVPKESSSIVGSNSKNTAGDLYAIDVSLNIALPAQKRNKRVLDLAVCLITAILSPILLFLFDRPMQFFANWWNVFIGQFSWVGYVPTANYNLPKLKKGVLKPVESSSELTKQTLYRLNFLYAKEYTTLTDCKIVWYNWRKMGRKI